jgi:hypothetical protein
MTSFRIKQFFGVVYANLGVNTVKELVAHTNIGVN